MYRFVYVFDKGTAESLMAQGYVPIKMNEKNNVYVFENKTELLMKFTKKDFVFSNTLSF